MLRVELAGLRICQRFQFFCNGSVLLCHRTELEHGMPNVIFRRSVDLKRFVLQEKQNDSENLFWVFAA
jgi:hypothetical protein